MSSVCVCLACVVMHVPSVCAVWTDNWLATKRGDQFDAISRIMFGSECVGAALRLTDDGIISLPRHVVEINGVFDIKSITAFGEQPRQFLGSNPA